MKLDAGSCMPRRWVAAGHEDLLFAIYRPLVASSSIFVMDVAIVSKESPWSFPRLVLADEQRA